MTPNFPFRPFALVSYHYKKAFQTSPSVKTDIIIHGVKGILLHGVLIPMK